MFSRELNSPPRIAPITETAWKSGIRRGRPGWPDADLRLDRARPMDDPDEALADALVGAIDAASAAAEPPPTTPNSRSDDRRHVDPAEIAAHDRAWPGRVEAALVGRAELARRRGARRSPASRRTAGDTANSARRSSRRKPRRRVGAGRPGPGGGRSDVRRAGARPPPRGRSDVRATSARSSRAAEARRRYVDAELMASQPASAWIDAPRRSEASTRAIASYPRSPRTGPGRYEAIALVGASERLARSTPRIRDTLSVSVDVPSDRLAAALDLVAEVLVHPDLPGPEVERLRDDGSTTCSRPRPIRAPVEEAFVGTIYALELALSPTVGGTRETVRPGVRPAPRYQRHLHPAQATLIVGGDLGPRSVGMVERLLGRGMAPARPRPQSATIAEHGAPRPGHASAASVQTKIRVGHRGVPRRIPSLPMHVSVMGAILEQAVQLTPQHEAA